MLAAYDYDDTLERLTKVERAYGQVGDQVSRYAYNDVAQYVDAAKDRFTTNDGQVVARACYDGLGREIKSIRGVGTSTVEVSGKRYDGFGRVTQVANPQAGSADCNPLSSGDWTTTAYDELDRVVGSTAPSGAQTVISYALNVKSVTEPDNVAVKRWFTSDALDRLASVTEEPNGANDVTSYTYDGEGRLKSVTQGTQPARLFTYDLAGRLLTARNPESGTITYAYDLNGNMIRRLDALGVVACFGNLNGTCS